MSAAATTDEVPAKKSKKMLIIIIVAVVVLALAGAGGAFFILKKNTAAQSEDHEDQDAPANHAADPGKPPTFLPLDSMVVNLADPSGNRVVQLGITLRVQDAHTSDAIKVFMPTIRNDILIVVSKRTADEVLSAGGKEKLANEILEQVSSVMGYEIEGHDGETDDGSKKKKKGRPAPPNPLQGVLFSSFIVQ
jgi:flagellar FliL protein